jgi:prepilin-type N-terminal cleavage/methylation domain-containing protein
MRARFSRNGRRGFTLIELMISVSVGAMILVGAYMCLSASFASQKLIDPRIDTLQTARVTLAMMTADLRAACPLDKNFAFVGMHRAVGLADADNLDFATHNYMPRREREADYCEVSYFAQRDEESGLLNLWRRRNPTLAEDPLSGGRREEIAKGLSGVRFEYTDGLDWYDAWGETNNDKKTGLIAQSSVNLDGMPQAVRITLSFPADTATNAAPSLEAVPSERSAEAEPTAASGLVFQTVVKLELADSGSLPVAGGSASSTTPNSQNGPNMGAPDGSGGGTE